MWGLSVLEVTLSCAGCLLEGDEEIRGFDRFNGASGVPGVFVGKESLLRFGVDGAAGGDREGGNGGDEPASGETREMGVGVDSQLGRFAGF